MVAQNSHPTIFHCLRRKLPEGGYPIQKTHNISTCANRSLRSGPRNSLPTAKTAYSKRRKFGYRFIVRSMGELGSRFYRKMVLKATGSPPQKSDRGGETIIHRRTM